MNTASPFPPRPRVAPRKPVAPKPVTPITPVAAKPPKTPEVPAEPPAFRFGPCPNLNGEMRPPAPRPDGQPPPPIRSLY